MRLLPVVATSRCGYFPLRLLPVAATSRCGYFPLRLLPVVTTSRCHYFPLWLLPVAATSRSGYFPLWLLPVVATSRCGYFLLWLLPVAATSRCGYFPLRLLYFPVMATFWRSNQTSPKLVPLRLLLVMLLKMDVVEYAIRKYRKHFAMYRSYRFRRRNTGPNDTKYWVCTKYGFMTSSLKFTKLVGKHHPNIF